MSKFEYVKLADAIAADITKGTLRPGDRLPPQRNFAYDRGIAVSTASRVYTELLRRGLVVGEVGRGTFISGDIKREVEALSEPRDARIDFEVNYPLLPQQWAMIAKSLAGLERVDALESALRVSTSTGTKSARNAAVAYLARKDFTPQAEQIVFTANGKQSLAAALAALVPTGGRCGVEALTYPYVKSIAARLGVTLVPIPMDEYGARPDAIQKAHREAHLSALYLQPIIQNPLGVTMNATRRADIMRVAEKLDLTIIEDAVYGFLADDTPLAALGPDRCIVIDSLSKKVAPGLALGILVTPPHLRESVMSAVRTGGWIASGHALASGQRLMADGTVAELTRLKRIDAARRQQTAARLLAGYQIAADARSYHLLADAAATLALADLRRRSSPARHRTDAILDVCNCARTCTERGAARARPALARAARFRPAHTRCRCSAPRKRISTRRSKRERCERSDTGSKTRRNKDPALRRSGRRPFRDKAPRLVRLDLVPFVQDTPAKLDIGVPERARRRKAVDGEQHLLDVRPVPVQRHRVAARRPGVAEADHAPDVSQSKRCINDRQREDHVLAGVHCAMFLEDEVRRNAGRDHRCLDDGALRLLRARRHTTADNRPAEKALAPQPRGGVGAQANVLAGAEHEQQIGRPERRIDQMRTVDFDDLIRCRLLPVAIHGWHDSTMRHRRRGTKSRLIAADCT